MITDYLKIVLKGFIDRKLRSWLTMIGIIIGIAAVVSLISLGMGLEKAIVDEFEELGSDKIIIQPKNAFASPVADVTNPLTKNDVEVVKDVKGIAEVASMYFTSVKVEFEDEVRYFFMSGMPTDEERKLIEQIQGFEIVEGRGLKRGDDNKVVVGFNHAYKKLFSRNLKLRDKILLEDTEFQVVGVMGRIGNPADDSSFWITDEAIRELYNKPEEVSFIMARASAGSDAEEVEKEVTRKLRKARDLEEGKEDFEASTPQQFLETLSVVLGIVQAVLVGIAMISLVVGGVGIMNTMYTSVLERTKEIGVMKATGARNKHILEIFVIESGFYGLVGGGIGVLVGIGIAKGIEYIGDTVLGIELLQAFISPSLIIGALLFSIVVGIISGAAPAYRASKQKPVDALRYE
jgi:putative ABC transport system permease protein